MGLLRYKTKSDVESRRLAGLSRHHKCSRLAPVSQVYFYHLFAQIHSQLRSGPCRVYPSAMRVRVSATGLYTYPDIVVACEDPRFLDERRDTLLNPTLIVEVLSESTEAYDRGRKFGHYRSIESLAEFLLVSSERIDAELFTRQPDGGWLLTAASDLQDTLQLSASGCRLPLADLYEKVEFR